MYRYGLTVVVCLLVSGGLAAGQTNLEPGATLGALSIPGPSGLTGFSRPVCLSPRVPNIPTDNDVGVSKIVSPGEYVALGDTVFPRAEVENFGLQTQTNVPVVCVFYDSSASARAYGPETVYVVSLGPGSVDTVDFPTWVPPVLEAVYFDTMRTENPGDEDTTNDWKAGRFKVTQWGLGHLTYNDGTFENGISWVMDSGEFAVRFIAPERPLTLAKAVLWLRSWYGDDYDAEVRVYANDGSPHGYPGTQLGTWVGKLHTDTWPCEYENEVFFDPPVEVDYDTFFVSYYQTSINPAYPYLAMDTIADTVDIGNDWGRYSGSGYSWGVFPYDPVMDFGIDAYYEAPLLDGSSADIAVPQGQIDSNTTFNPQIVVKNAGLRDRNNIAAGFYITRTSDFADTIYAGTANSGPIDAGQTKEVAFADSVTPEPGEYTVTSITLLPFDARPGNDTLVRTLSVSNLGVASEDAVGGRTSVSIAPNPLGKMATVRYSLPKAGFVRLNVYDVTGREVLTQTMAVGRTGTASLDLRKLEAGVYVVKVETDGFSSTQKVVVEH